MAVAGIRRCLPPVTTSDPAPGTRGLLFAHILTVNVDGKTQKVVLKDLQRHPSKPFVTHVDLLRVAEGDRIKMHVAAALLNEAPARVQGRRQVSHTMSDVEVICAAKDLPEYIEVDLGSMNVGDIVHLSDLKLPEAWPGGVPRATVEIRRSTIPPWCPFMHRVVVLLRAKKGRGDE